MRVPTFCHPSIHKDHGTTDPKIHSIISTALFFHLAVHDINAILYKHYTANP